MVNGFLGKNFTTKKGFLIQYKGKWSWINGNWFHGNFINNKFCDGIGRKILKKW